MCASVMVEGVSGLLAVHPLESRPLYEPSKRQVTLAERRDRASLLGRGSRNRCAGRNSPPPGATSCANGASRGEPGTCCNSALRLGERPRQVVTTTPRPMPLLKALLADPLTAVTRVRPRPTKPISRRRSSRRSSGATRARGSAGRSSTPRLLEDRADALWPRALIEARAGAAAPELRRIVVAVDPPAAAGRRRTPAASSSPGSARTGAAMCSPTRRASGAPARLGARGGRRSISASRPTASSPRSTRAATWSRR